MPINPHRRMAGGDVEGTTKTDVQWSIGKPVEIARASVDPGYETVLSRPDVSHADLLQGYSSYGRSIGEPMDRGDTEGETYDGKRRKLNGRLPSEEMGESCAELE